MAISVGSVSVAVVPDASRFAAELRAKLRDLPNVDIKVNADVQAAKAQIDALARRRDVSVKVNLDIDRARFEEQIRRVAAQSPSMKVDVNVDSATARAELDTLTRDRTVRIVAELDSAAARAALDLLTRDRTARIIADADVAAARAELDLAARDRTVTIRVNTSGLGAIGAAAAGSQGGVNGLLVAGAALGPAIIPVAGAVAAALTAIGPAAIAGVAGIGTLALGFSGIGAAVKALGAQNDGAAAAATKSAASQVSAAAQIQSAEASLANARAAAGDSAVRAAAAVRDAQRGVADATREAAAGVMSALQGQEQAERSLSQAQQSQRQAQLDLTQARMDAKQALEDLAFQVQDGELSQRQANLSVSQAQQNLWAVQADPKATELQRQQAQLAYDQAVQNLNEITVKNQRLKTEKAAADKAGVDGSKQVTGAQQKLNAATQATVDAQKAVKDAYAATAEARRAGAEKVAVAEERVTAATQAQAAAARQSAFSVAQAEASLAAAHRSAAAGAATATAAQTALQKAMDDLSPAGQRFARFIFGLKGDFDKLKATAQENLLPGVEAGIRAMLPLLPTFNRIVGNAATAMGGLFKAAGQALTAPFWRSFFDFIAKTVGPNIKAFGSIIGNLATGFAGLIIAFQPVAQQVTAGIVGLAKAFADWATHLGSNAGFQSFLAYIRDVGPKVAKTFGDLLLATIPLLQALAPLGGVVLALVDALAQFIAKCTPGQLLAIAGAISAVVIGLALFGGPVASLNAIVIAIAALAAGAVYAYQHFTPFRDFIDKFASGTLSAFHTALGYVKQALSENSGQMTQLWNACKTVAGFVMTYVVPAIGQYLRQALIGLGIAIAAAITIIGQMVTKFNTLRDTVTTAWSQHIHPAISAFGSAMSTLWSGIIKPALSSIVTAFLGLVSTIVHGAATAFGWMGPLGEKLKTAATQFDTFAASVTSSLNGIDGQNVEVGVNFKAGDSVALKGVENKHKAGGAFANPAERAAGGPIFGPGTGTSDSIPAMLSNGEHVLTAKEVEAAGGHAAIYAFRKHLRGFATGGAVTVGTSIPSTASMGSAVDVGFLQFFSDNMKKITDGLVQPFDGSKGAAQWASLVQRVLTELHQPLSDMAAVLRRIDFESGGNPNAINLTDSNARAGHPSQGLMQTIPTTFAGYAGPYRSRGITDPLANIYAGVSYALDYYGHDLKNIDPLNRPMGYDAGGWLQPGMTTVFNGTQKPEAIFTHEQFQSIKDGGLSGKGGPSVNYNGPVYVVDPEQIGRQNVNAMRDAIAVENLTGAL